MTDNLAHRWADVLEGGTFSEAACISWVRGLDAEEALRRLGASETPSRRTLADVDPALMKLHKKGSRGEPIGAVAAALDGWTLLVEPNGWAATMAGDLGAMSRGTEIVSIFWNVNGLAEITVARDGVVAAQVHEVLDYLCGDDEAPRSSLENVEGSAPELVGELLSELAKISGYDWLPTALHWAEKYTGTLTPLGAFNAPHPSVVFAKTR
jgi:hypothetical protein